MSKPEKQPKRKEFLPQQLRLDIPKLIEHLRKLAEAMKELDPESRAVIQALAKKHHAKFVSFVMLRVEENKEPEAIANHFGFMIRQLEEAQQQAEALAAYTHGPAPDDKAKEFVETLFSLDLGIDHDRSFFQHLVAALQKCQERLHREQGGGPDQNAAFKKKYAQLNAACSEIKACTNLIYGKDGKSEAFRIQIRDAHRAINIYPKEVVDKKEREQSLFLAGRRTPNNAALNHLRQLLIDEGTDFMVQPVTDGAILTGYIENEATRRECAARCIDEVHLYGSQTLRHVAPLDIVRCSRDIDMQGIDPYSGLSVDENRWFQDRWLSKRDDEDPESIHPDKSFTPVIEQYAADKSHGVVAFMHAGMGQPTYYDTNFPGWRMEQHMQEHFTMLCHITPERVKALLAKYGDEGNKTMLANLIDPATGRFNMQAVEEINHAYTNSLRTLSLHPEIKKQMVANENSIPVIFSFECSQYHTEPVLKPRRIPGHLAIAHPVSEFINKFLSVFEDRQLLQEEKGATAERLGKLAVSLIDLKQRYRLACEELIKCGIDEADVDKALRELVVLFMPTRTVFHPSDATKTWQDYLGKGELAPDLDALSAVLNSQYSQSYYLPAQHRAPTEDELKAALQEALIFFKRFDTLCRNGMDARQQQYLAAERQAAHESLPFHEEDIAALVPHAAKFLTSGVLSVSTLLGDHGDEHMGRLSDTLRSNSNYARRYGEDFDQEEVARSKDFGKNKKPGYG